MKRLSILVMLLTLFCLILAGCGEASHTQPTTDEVIEKKTEETPEKEYPLANVTLGGVPLSKFAIERDVRLAGTSDAAEALKGWLAENTGVMPVEDKNAPNRIRLVSDPMLDIDVASAVLEDGILTLAINQYGRSISDAVELFYDILENRSSDELKTIQETQSNAEEKHQLRYLNNTYAKLMAGEELNISFIGGSVTFGDGSSDPAAKSWASLISSRFEDTYGVKVNRNNVAIGGTGSYLGAFRYEHQIEPENPDLLFIEFAINDSRDDVTYEDVVRTSETLVLKAYEQNPNVDIIYVLTFDQGYAAYDYPQLCAHRDVAEKYGLMYVKVASHFYTHLARTGDLFINYIADDVHPKDAGYALYADFIWETIQDDFPTEKTAASVKAHTWDEESLSTPMMNAHMEFPDEVSLEGADGWVYQDGHFAGHGKNSHGKLVAAEPGAKLTYTFEGTDFGIFHSANPSMGKVSVTIDDGEPAIVNGYYGGNTPKSARVATLLENGRHTVVIELISENDFEIGAFLVN